jgi:hypothetical protein
MTIYVPLLMITHFAAFYLLVRPHPKAAQALDGDAAKDAPTGVEILRV